MSPRKDVALVSLGTSHFERSPLEDIFTVTAGGRAAAGSRLRFRLRLRLMRLGLGLRLRLRAEG